MKAKRYLKYLLSLLAVSVCVLAQAHSLPTSALPIVAASTMASASSTVLPTLESSWPKDGATDITPSAHLTLRFNEPLDARSLGPDSVTLMGPEGSVVVKVVPGDNSKTLVVVPGADLYPATRYNVFVNGPSTAQSNAGTLAIFGFTTASISSGDAARAPGGAAAAIAEAAVSPSVNDDERWQPTESNRHGKWRTGRALADSIALRRNEAMSPLSRAYSEGSVRAKSLGASVTGVVLRQNDKPLTNVKVSIGNISSRTNSTGEFVLSGLTAGQQELIVDGRDAGDGRTSQYGYFVIGVNVTAGKDTPVAPIFLPKILKSDWINLSSPLSVDTIVRTPAVPGMEIHIPKGAVLRDREGKIVTQIAVVPMPLDRSPFPFPENAPAYVTVQPGGMTVQGLAPGVTAGIRVHYPNQTDLKPGERVSFWSYNTDSRGWQIYGEGEASPDGAHVVPDPGVALYESIGFMYTLGNPPPDPTAPPPDGCKNKCCNGSGPGGGFGGGSSGGGSDGGGSNGGSGTGGGSNNESAGDPVDCKSGLFVLERNDTFVRGVIPIEMARTYRPGSTVSRSFGYGTQTNYAIYLREVSNAPGGRYTQYDLILPDGSFVRFYRTSPGNDYTSVVAIHNTSASPWYAAVFDYENGNYVVTTTSGTKYIFSLYGTLQTIQDRLGNHLDLAHNGGQITRITSTSGRYLDFTYDTSSRITQIKDFGGRTWNYQYSTAGYLTQTTYPDGLFEQYGYDPSGNMLTLVDRRGTTVVTNQYDANGRVSQQTLADGSIYTFTYTLDTNSTVTQTDVTDPRGNIRRVTYGALGYKASVTHAAGSAIAQTTSFERDSTSGLLTAIVDPLGRRTTFQRDTSGNITQKTQLAGTNNAISESSTYGKFSLLATHTNPLGNITNYTYDSLGNLLTVTDPLGDTRTFTYNAAGQSLTATDALNETATYAYDPNGDLRTVTDPLGRAHTYYIDAFGRQIGGIDPLHRESSIEYDAMGRVSKTTDPLTQSTTYLYDPNGNLLSVTDPNGGLTKFGYDTRNRPTSRTDALNQGEFWTYDGIGNALTHTDRKHQQTTYQYDALDRASLVTYADNSTVTPTFDAGNRLTKIVDTASGTINRTYDGLDRLIQEQSPQGTVGYSYDAAGRRIGMTPAAQGAVSYSYDVANRLYGISQNSEYVGFNYDSADRVSLVGLPNGVVQSYNYDAANEITSIGYQGPSGQAALVYASTGKTLGHTPPPCGVCYPPPAGGWTGGVAYTYDAGGQRVSETGTFGPDGAAPANYANPLPLPAYTGQFDFNNRQTLTNSQALTYDANGNLTNDGVSTYVWDARNRLIQVTQSGTTLGSYQYDTFGRRTNKNGIALLYDGVNPIQETQGSTVMPLLTGLGVDQYFARTQSTGQRDYYLTDALNSTVALTDSSGNVGAQYFYGPNGEKGSSGGGSQHVHPTSDNPYQYTGRENDVTGLYYYRARYYSPSLKRFISEDPMGLAAGLNEYSYALGNPLLYVDPLGLDVLLCHRPADIDHMHWVNHYWFKTDTYESGMGGACPVPGQGCADTYGSATMTKDHTGQSLQPNASCEPVPLDEQCVDKAIKPGQPTGPFIPPINSCQTFASGVISQCSLNPPFVEGQ